MNISIVLNQIKNGETEANGFYIFIDFTCTVCYMNTLKKRHSNYIQWYSKSHLENQYCKLIYWLALIMKLYILELISLIIQLSWKILMI